MNTMLDVIGKVLVLGLARPLQTRMRRSAPLLAFFTPSKLLCGNHGLSRLIYTTYPALALAWMAPRPLSPGRNTKCCLDMQMLTPFPSWHKEGAE